MSIEVRAARAEEMEEFSRLMAYVFAGTPPEHPDAQPQTLLRKLPSTLAPLYCGSVGCRVMKSPG